jgi:hypothetical protein
VISFLPSLLQNVEGISYQLTTVLHGPDLEPEPKRLKSEPELVSEQESKLTSETYDMISEEFDEDPISEESDEVVKWVRWLYLQMSL